MIRDISPPVSPAVEVWPGDTPFTSRKVMELAAGDSCNVTTIQTTVHVGAHADAPLHFAADAADAATVDLDPYLGPARVVRLPTDGAITRAQLESLDLAGVVRLLVHTRSLTGPPSYSGPMSHLDPEAAAWLAARRFKLVGLDSYSVDHRDSKTLPSHHALLAGGVRNLEGLDLTGVPPGDYELIALPLRLVGCDASPVRAILRDLPG
jgi:arylformamidase